MKYTTEEEIRWWAERLRLSDVRAALREMCEDPDDRSDARRALEALRGARRGRYTWIDIETLAGRADAGVLRALAQAGTQVLTTE